MTKRLSAVDAVLAEQAVEGFQLTDDIVIAPPSRRQAEAIQKTDDPDEIMEIILGDQFEAASAILKNLPIQSELRVMELMMEHFTADLPTVDDVVDRLGLQNADAKTIAKAVAAKKGATK